MADSDKYFVSEDNYDSTMKSTVEPYLAARMERRMLSREPGMELYCERYTADRPCGVIVMAHGFTETTDKYHELIYYFLKEDLTVYIYDHCGHGRSYRLTDDPSKVHVDTYERYVGDLLLAAGTAAKECAGLPLYLFGHSMGGGIAAAAAAKEPSLFAKAVLSSPMIRPATGGVPWGLTRFLCGFFCMIGRADGYVIGQGPYNGNESFEESASVSEPRFSYYNRIRAEDPLKQMNGATYGWLRSAAHLSAYLLKEACRLISCPVLLFQAEDDGFVINARQDEFISKLEPRIPARLVRVLGTKHEIFNSHDDVVKEYVGEIVSFLK